MAEFVEKRFESIGNTFVSAASVMKLKRSSSFSHFSVDHMEKLSSVAAAAFAEDRHVVHEWRGAVMWYLVPARYLYNSTSYYYSHKFRAVPRYCTVLKYTKAVDPCASHCVACTPPLFRLNLSGPYAVDPPLKV